MQDRPYQVQAHKNIRGEWLKGINRQLIAMATGTGKTVIFSGLPDRMHDVLPGQMLILAHREELIDQAIDKMRTINPGLRIDKEMANHKADPSLADAIVASVATLGRKGTKRIANYNWERVDKIVTDEAHHSVAQTYMNIYEASGILTAGDRRLLLGVTATPQRGDGKALREIYQKISFVYSMRQAITDGWIVDVCGIRVRTGTSLDEVRTVAGDFDSGDLANTVNNEKRNQLVVKAWLENGENRPTIVYCVDIQHTKDLAEMFRHYGVAAEAVWGNDPDRAKKLAMHREGAITVLLNCGILTEGYDDWRISCIVLARPTKSSVLFTQMVGRATRLQEGCGNLLSWTGAPIKRNCIVIDVVDNSHRHSLVTLPTLMGLSTAIDLKGESVVGAAIKLEEAQKLYPHIDFTKITDISTINAYIEKVNLFDIKFPEEVESNSELSWHHSATGGYTLLLPNKEKLTICQNMLDKYDISGIIKGKRYKGERDTVEDAFAAADGIVQSECPEALRVIRRRAPWHSDPATVPQLKTLARLFPGKALPLDMSKGHAGRLIGSHYAGRN
jgi:superfamily II DNA or RNA helicase